MRKILLMLVIIILCMTALSNCEKHTHDYVKETVVEADCSKSGLNTYTCECGDSYDESIPSTENHVWNDGIISTEVTCITDGIVLYTCVVCENTREENISAVGEHNWGEFIITKEASCAEEGQSSITCENCGDVETASIAKLETHTWNDGETTKSATCAEDGILTYTCTVCNITKTESIPVINVHTWDAGKTTKEPTCRDKGELIYTCQICNATKNEEIEKINVHVWDNGTVTKTETCSDNGARKYTCTVCQTTKTEDIAASGLHKWDNGVVTQTSSCAEYGNMKFTCTVCGKYKNEKISKTDDHSWNSGIITLKATCSKEGTVTYSCLLCGINKSESIDPTGEHTWSKYVSVEPTYTTEGVLLYDCTQCDNEYTETIKTYNFNPDWYGNSQYIKNSNKPDNYVEFEIVDNVLKITGKIIYDDLDKLWLRCGDAKTQNEYSKIIPVSSGQTFSVELSLDHIRKETFVTIYTHQKNGDGHYWGYIWNEVAIVPEKNGYGFVHSLVLDNNIEVMKHWVDPRDCLSDSISEQLIELSNTIVGKETDEYQKLYLLNKWVAENIYYDYDYYYGRSKEIYTSADEVFQYRRSVCAGYARLLNALVQAQGIPCMEVSTFSAGISTIGYFNESNYLTTNSNHAHVEAYLASEDRWVIMDPTWDSRNKYENGKFIDGVFSDKYFDMSLDFFSFTHKLLRRPD